MVVIPIMLDFHFEKDIYITCIFVSRLEACTDKIFLKNLHKTKTKVCLIVKIRPMCVPAHE